MKLSFRQIITSPTRKAMPADMPIEDSGMPRRICDEINPLRCHCHIFESCLNRYPSQTSGAGKRPPGADVGGGNYGDCLMIHAKASSMNIGGRFGCAAP
jgi:hypothetical protein